MKFLAALLFPALTAHPISAAVAYTQAPVGGGFLSAKYTVNGSNLDEFVWDYFSVATTQTLREIQWRGTSLPASHAGFVISINTILATAMPTEGGVVIGAGIVGNGASVTLTATAAPGFYFTDWTLDGLPAGAVNPVTFNTNADHIFEVNFNPLPVLLIASAAGSGFSLTWPDTLTDWILQESADLSPESWVDSLLPITNSGGQNQISIPNPTGQMFFRLAKP